MVALSDSHMEIKVTDPDRGKKQLSNKASTATAKSTTKGSKKKKHGPSSPSTTKQRPKSPTAELQQGDDIHIAGKTSVKPSSESVADSQEVSHTEPTLNMESKLQAETEPGSGLAQNKVESLTKEEETVELLENTRSEQSDGGVHKEIKEKTVTKKKGLDLDSVRVEATADPNLLVKEDGSVFVNVDKNYTKTRLLDRVTQKQEPKESKFQFSNQLAFSLD